MLSKIRNLCQRMQQLLVHVIFVPPNPSGSDKESQAGKSKAQFKQLFSVVWDECKNGSQYESLKHTAALHRDTDPVQKPSQELVPETAQETAAEEPADKFLSQHDKLQFDFKFEFLGQVQAYCDNCEAWETLQTYDTTNRKEFGEVTTLDSHNIQRIEADW